VGLPKDDHVKPPKGLGFPFGGAFPFRPFLIRRKFIALLTRIPNLLEEGMRRSYPEGALMKPLRGDTLSPLEASSFFGGIMKRGFKRRVLSNKSEEAAMRSNRPTDYGGTGRGSLEGVFFQRG